MGSNSKTALLISLFLTFILFFAAAETVTIGYFNKDLVIFNTENPLPEGIAVDILNEIADKESWDLEFVFGTFPETINRLIDGEIDLIAALGYTEERENSIDYSNETLLESWGSVFSNREASIKTIKDLEGKKVGYIKNSLFKEPFIELADSFGLQYELSEYSGYESMFEDILSGRISGGLGDRLSYLHYSKNEFSRIDSNIAFHPFSLYAAAQKGDPKRILYAFDEYMREAKKSRTSRYYSIINKWFLNLNNNENNDTFTLYALIVLLIFISLLYLMTRAMGFRRILGINWYIQTTTGRNVIIFSLLLLSAVWIIDSIMLWLWFNPDNINFLEALLSINNTDELLDRLMYVGPIIISGIVISRVFDRVLQEQQKTKAREEDLRTTLDSIGDGVISTDTNGKIVRMNPVAEQLTGWKYTEAEGLNLDSIFNIFEAGTNRRAENPVSEVLQNRKITTLAGHTVLRSITGEEYHIADSAAPIYSANNKFSGAVLVFRDITEEYILQERLKRNINFTESLLNSVPTAVFFKDSNGFYQGCNRIFSEFFGISSEDLKGKTVYDLWPADLAEKYEKADLELLANPERQVYEFKIKDKTGLTKPVIFAKDVYYDESNRVAGIVGSFIDISRRKQAEMELLYLQNYLTNIIDSMPSILIGVDSMGIITQWNLEAEKRTGKEKKDVKGLNLEDAIPEFNFRLEQIQKAVSTKKAISEHGKIRYEKEFAIYEDITIYPLISDSFEGAVIRIDDVTEKIKMEEMLIQSEKMLSVGGLAAGMAHKINNPLAGMIQTADVLKNRLTGDIPASIKAAEDLGITIQQIQKFMEMRNIPEMLERIRSSGKRASNIVRNMLSFARKSESKYSSHNIAEIMDQTLALAENDYNLKKKYDFRNLEIIREYDKDLLEIPCDTGKIQQVFFNILRNSAEAMHVVTENEKEEQKKLIIQISHQKESGFIQIEISDEGPGMDEETRKRVFEPFFTTKPPDIGTGLGLSVSYFIVTENHGGEMSVESEPGKGAKFTVRIPTKREN